ncbi:MAG TPA: prepilin peptidase [Candidatus Saccharimonadales bacterium]|nr:prepilin peptidase [Candidatus Saccharimonadales bacterium]
MGGIVAFVFGLVFGSFLNVVILRFDEWRTILTGRSHCPDCRTDLRWYDLIPVISYATLKGRCRYCGRPISWQYPVVETATAFLLAGGYFLIFNTSSLTLASQIGAFIAFIVAIGALVVMFFHDLKEMLIPDFFAYVLLFGAAIFSLLYYQNPLHSLYGALIGFLPVALLVYPSRGTWMGEGDLKLAAGLGLLAGYPNAIVFVSLAFVIGGVFGAILLLTKRAKLKTAVPFGPFLIIGGLLALFWGTTAIAWYLGGMGL